MEALKTKKKSSEIKSDNQIDNIDVVKIFISTLIEALRKPDNKKTLEKIAGELRNGRDGTKRKISDDLFTSIIEKINLLSNKYAKSKEFSDAVIKAISDDVRKNSIEPVSILPLRINEQVKPKERDNPMKDREDAIQKVRSMLSQALQDVPESDGNRALRRVVKKAVSILAQLPTPTQSVQMYSVEITDLPTKPPVEAPIKWANRATFSVIDIKDEYIRKKLQNNPEIVQKLRECTAEDAKFFLDAIYGDYIKAGLIFRGHLAGRKRTATNPNPTKAWDKRFVDILDEQKLSTFLPNNSAKINSRELFP